jgi:hypothetical protein
MIRCCCLLYSLLLLTAEARSQTIACEKLDFIEKFGEEMRLTKGVEVILNGGAMLECRTDKPNRFDSNVVLYNSFYFNPALTSVECYDDSVVLVQNDITSAQQFWTRRLTLKFLDGSNTLESVILQSRNQGSGRSERISFRLRHVPLNPNAEWVSLFDPTYPSTLAYVDYVLDQQWNSIRSMTFKQMNDTLDWVVGVRTTMLDVLEEDDAVPMMIEVKGRSVSVALPSSLSGQLTIYDLLGREVVSSTVDATTITHLTMPRGVYIARFVCQTHSLSRSFSIP